VSSFCDGGCDDRYVIVISATQPREIALSVTTSTVRNPQPRAAGPSIKPAGRELELKFLVGEPAFRATQTWPMLPPGQARRAVRLRSFYYDTAQGDLHRHKMAFRMRAQRRGYVMTLKYDGGFPGGLFERGEVEVFSASETPDPGLLGPEFCNAIAAAAGDRPLVLAYETDIRRITHRIVTPTSDIELAFDSGFIIAGEKKISLREIELELKSGSADDLYSLGIQLAAAFPVQLGTQQKSDRGFLVLTETPPPVVRARPPFHRATSDGEISVDQAIAILINDCLAQFTANWPAFDAGDAVNAVHQMRVALRRLRALLGMFQRSFACLEFSGFREAAKRLASAMGEARNFDVFLDTLRHGPCQAFPDDSGMAEMVDECEVRREAGHGQVRELLASPETTKFVLSLQAFTARHGWRNALAPEVLAHLTGPARVFAAAQISRLRNKILKRGRKHLALNPHDRHELRIDLKKLRYATDSFGTLFDEPKQVRAFAKAASQLQDSLGTFNDLIVANELIGSLSCAQSRAAGIAIGWCARAAISGDETLREDWKRFRKSVPPGP
jgi:triphosphatase